MLINFMRLKFLFAPKGRETQSIRIYLIFVSTEPREFRDKSRGFIRWRFVPIVSVSAPVIYRRWNAVDSHSITIVIIIR